MSDLREALDRLRELRRIRDAEGPPPEMTLAGSYRKGYTSALDDAIEFMIVLSEATPGSEPALDVDRLKEAAMQVESGYILMPDRTARAYWSKIAARHLSASQPPEPDIQ